MKYIEVTQDLFTAPPDYALVHCISADFALGAGIAVQFQKRYNTRNELRSRCPNYKFHGGDCLGTGSRGTRAVFNLVTKKHSWQKPTYKDLEDALYELLEVANLSGYKKLAMPKIGCGLDGLKWEKVKSIIQSVFEWSDMEIMICSLK
ncbi:MAG: macro domain-containing protein [Bacilli bacterium]|nr:macro domain-containing protein [Bacilli bacterium]